LDHQLCLDDTLLLFDLYGWLSRFDGDLISFIMQLNTNISGGPAGYKSRTSTLPDCIDSGL